MFFLSNRSPLERFAAIVHDVDDDGGAPGFDTNDDDLLGAEDMNAGPPAPASDPTDDTTPAGGQADPEQQGQEAALAADPSREGNRAFEEQRRRLEAESERRAQEAYQAGLRAAQQQAAPVEAAKPVEPVDAAPDPNAYPEGEDGDRRYMADRDAWLIRQAKRELMAEIAPQLQQVAGQAGSLAAAEQQRSAAARLGADWDAACDFVNGLLAEANQPGAENDPFLRMVRDGWKNAHDQPAFGEALFKRFGKAAPVDVKAVEQDAYTRGAQAATKQHQERAAKNPHLLAPPSVSSLPAAPVVTTATIRPGSKEEEAILGQE